MTILRLDIRDHSYDKQLCLFFIDNCKYSTHEVSFILNYITIIIIIIIIKILKINRVIVMLSHCKKI